MLVTRTTYGAEGVCSFVLMAKRLVAPLAVLVSFAMLGAQAAEYDVLQISSDEMVSRDPVIGETGFAAWGAYRSTELGGTAADVMIYSNGVAKPLFRTRPRDNPANFRPDVHSNSLVWVGMLAGSSRTVAWQLREVPAPDRDTPVPELPANYYLDFGEGGQQLWSTNPPVVTNAVPAATNAPAPAEAVTNLPPPAAEPETTSETGAVRKAKSADLAVPSEPPVVKPPPDTVVPAEEPRRLTSGDTEILLWQGGSDIFRLTEDNRDDLGPSIWGNLIAWQTAKGWPFGWEIMAWAGGELIQLTTNYYYDMAPKVHGSQVVWYGWDGHDFEIFLYDHSKDITTQITSNQYDDVSPALWDGVIAWEGYAGADADIFMWKDGQTRKISENIEDDLNPRVWNGQAVWQGFDGDDFEIYLFDGDKTIKLTSNTYDDVNPDIRDGVICWMGYHSNWDAEIFVWDGGAESAQLTENEFEDRNPRTAGRRVIWESEQGGKSLIFLAEPKK